MTKIVLGLPILLCLLFSGTNAVLAQEQPPPRFLQIFREEVKPGKVAAHEKVEVGWPRAFAKAKWPTHYVALTSISGPNEAWFLSGFDSFAAWGKDQKDLEKAEPLRAETDRLSQQDGELLSGIRSIAATFREDLSYRPNVHRGLIRYVSVQTVRLRPGHGNDFVEARKIAKAAHEKANVDDHSIVYQVLSGAPGGTYLIFRPMKSLQEMDAVPQLHGQAYQDAVGDEGRKKLRELSIAGTLFTETNLFAVSPKMSYVSKEVAAADPDFWNPKPKVAKPEGASPGKGGAKPVTNQ